MNFRDWIKRPGSTGDGARRNRYSEPDQARELPRAFPLRVPMFRASLAAFLLCAAPAFAQSFQDQYVAQLHQQGFEQISIRRTLLGRVRIVALSDAFRRELVFMPDTGTILRDYWVELDDDDGNEDDDPILFNPNGGGGLEDGGDDGGGDGGDDSDSGDDDDGQDDDAQEDDEDDGGDDEEDDSSDDEEDDGDDEEEDDD